MKKNKIYLTVFLIFVVVSAACNLPGTTQTDDPNPPAATEEPGGQNPPVEIPQFTQTPSETPRPTLTFTPEVPTVSVSVETNCRTGPGTVYDILGVLFVGQTAEVVGRSAASDNWIIKLPSNPAITCWLWGQYATVTGDTTSLPVVAPPPTPTPAASFSATYLNTVTCGGLYGFRIKLVNTGSILWSSYKVDTYDATTGTSTTYTDDYFKDYTGCGPFANELHDLEPGEDGVGGNWVGGVLHYDPAGHNITITLTLCPNDGMTGACISKSISFVP